MTSSLAAQLQRITANSTNTLNTQKLRQIHSASLLFPAAHATTQDLDTIYSIAIEGFRELCQLDNRYIAYERGLFSESSKGVDRFLLPKSEVDDLDRSIEGFLQLVSGKLLLRPAVKAVEWLVRRFRVQEQNTAAVLLCFLPYHSHPTIFPTLLGIIEKKSIPHEFLFLTPYIKPAAPVPRHVVTHALSHRRDFFTLLSEYVTSVVRSRRDNHALLSFYSTVVTESVSLMCDATRKKGGGTEEDVLHKTMSILEEGYKARKSPEFQIGCYMLTTVLVSKLTLSGQLLLSLMQGVVAGWVKESLSAGLACLAFLAQARQGEKEVRISDEITKGLLKVDDIATRLLAMGEKYRVDKLVVGLCLGVLDRLGKKYGLKELTTTIKLLEEARMGPKQRHLVVKRFVDAAQKIGGGQVTEQGINNLEDVKEKLAESLVCWSALGEKRKLGKYIKEVLEDDQVDIDLLELKLQTVIRPAQITAIEKLEAQKAIEPSPVQPVESFDDILATIPDSVQGDSFLSFNPPAVLERLSQAFFMSITSGTDFAPVLALPLFANRPVDNALTLSLLVYIWTSARYPALARTIALREALAFIKSIKQKVDFQALIPHLLVALADPAQNVRREAAVVIATLTNNYKELGGSSRKGRKRRKSAEGVSDEATKYWGIDTIYGKGRETEAVKWLETSEALKMLKGVVEGKLEECVLDADVIGRVLEGALSSSASASPEKVGLKSSMKTSVIAFLSSHAVNIPGLLAKQRLLTMLNRIEKATTSRTQFLLPVLANWITVSDYAIHVSQCIEERVNITALEEQLVSVVSEGSPSVAVLVGVIEKGLCDSLRVAAAVRITKIWNSLEEDIKINSAESLLEISLRGEDSGEAAPVLREVILPTEVFSKFFEESSIQLKSVLPGGSAMAKNKRQRTTLGVAAQVENDEDQAIALRRVTVVSELLEGQGAEKHPSLLRSLFGVLADVGSVEYAGIAYLHGVLLSCMLAIVKSYKNSKSVSLDSSVRADVLVNTIRSTASPQVQNSALLLLAALADIAPDVVKHSVMPIFTFMGANTLRQDDEYSAHVIEQTIQRVIPPLVKGLQEQGGNPVIGVAELIGTFVASYKHIPAHRRVRLFVALTETLGVGEFLFTLLAKLAERYKVTLGAGQVRSADDGNIGEFCAMLAGNFGAEMQLLNVDKYLDVVLDVLEPSPSGLAKHIFEEPNDTSSLELAGRLLKALAYVLKSDNLRARAARALKDESVDSARLRAYFSDAMEKTLALGEKYGNTEISGEISQALENLLDLLSTPQFVDVVETLVDRPESKFRRSALKTFKDRVTHEARTNATSRSAVLALMPKIAAIISGVSSNELKADALSCIDAVTIKYGKQGLSIVASLTDAVISDGGLKSSDDGLRVLSLVCLTSMTSCLGGRIIPVLPKTVPFALDQLRASIQEDAVHEMIHNAVFAFLDELVKTVPSFMASYLLRLLPLIYGSAGSYEFDDEIATGVRKDLLKSIATNMDAKTVMSALLKTWDDAAKEGTMAVDEVLSTVERVIDGATKSTVQKIHTSLLQFLLLTFDIRRTSNFDGEDIEHLEERSLKVALQMVYKLNDTIFKPMFLRMLEWAAEDLRDRDPEGRRKRLVIFWDLLTMLCDNLKSLITEYYGYVLENAVEVVSKGLDNGNKDLWEAVLKCLNIGFSTDERDFWQSPTHFDKIAPTLLSSLNGTTAKLVTPAIVELANAAQSEDHFKSINTQVLQYMRSEDAGVRLAAVETMTALYAKMGEEWLPLLPESVPFIAELMEDDEENVEWAVQRLIVKVEEFLGAGELEAMLN